MKGTGSAVTSGGAPGAGIAGFVGSGVKEGGGAVPKSSVGALGVGVRGGGGTCSLGGALVGAGEGSLMGLVLTVGPGTFSSFGVGLLGGGLVFSGGVSVGAAICCVAAGLRVSLAAFFLPLQFAKKPNDIAKIAISNNVAGRL